MMEMLMLLGAGLVAAGLAGMSGILPQMGHAEAGQADASDGGLGEGESKDLLGRIREMGLLPDFGGKKSAEDADADDAETVLDPIAAFEQTDGFDMSQFIAETGVVHHEEVDEDDEEVAFDLPLVADHINPVTQTEAHPEAAAEQEVTDQAAQDDLEVEALLARLGTVEQADTVEETGEGASDAPLGLTADDMHDDLAEEETFDDEIEDETFDDDEIPVITDFIAGEDSLMLMMPEDMDDDTAIRIEPVGEAGADAAIVLEDARGSLTAAVIRGGFGSVRPEDIELERAA